MAKALIGAKLKRREDPRLITGAATYVDDIYLRGMLFLALRRSEYAHARIKGINVERAQELPGVVAVYTGQQVNRLVGDIPVAAQLPGMKIPAHGPLALDTVRYVGEPVVAVLATDRYLARDALDLIDIDYELLPAVVDVEQAMAGGTLVHEKLGSNVAYHWTIGGDVSAAFKKADVVVKERLVNHRLIPSAMETRGVVAQHQADTLTLWSSTQIPHLLRTQLAKVMGLSEHRLRVIAPEVGGGFGSKLNVYPEELLAGVLAKQLGRPVKWIEDRRENFLATTHGRDQVAYCELAAKRDGTMLGLKMKIIADLGAYHQIFTPAIPTFTGLMLPAVYQFPVVFGEVYGVFTNKTPTDAYRGAGRPEATYYLERMVDLLAFELGLDPAGVRRKNFIPPKAFPFKTATGLTYDSGNYAPALDKALKMVGYKKFRQEQARLRQEGKCVGIGLSSYVEICGIGPSSALPIGGWETGTVRVEPTGKVTVLTGTSPHGQGQETSFAQIVGDELGVAIDDVVVQHGDTAVVSSGVGTFGSRATAVGGTAVLMAARQVKEKAQKLAAHLLEAKEKNLEFRGGRFRIKGSRKKGLTMAEIAQAAYRAASLPKGLEPTLEASASFEPSNFTFPFGTQVAVVEVDPDTGQVTLLRYVAVDDCGKVINPLLVEGQVHGGIVQGVAQALWEEAVYDQNGQLLSGSFMDYAIPVADFLPRFELGRTETPSPVNPLGVKGVGEAGTIAATPAVVNAVLDALWPLGVRHLDMPLRAEKVWRAITEAKRSSQ